MAAQDQESSLIARPLRPGHIAQGLRQIGSCSEFEPRPQDHEKEHVLAV